MKQIATTFLFLFFTITVITFGLTALQVIQERERLESDLARRSIFLAESFKESIEPNLANNAHTYIQTLVERYANRDRFAGLVVYDNKENVVASSSNLQDMPAPKIVADAMDENLPNGDFLTSGGKPWYFVAVPLQSDNKVIGSLMVVQNATYINDRIIEIWKNSLLRWFVQVVLVVVVVMVILKIFVLQPINTLVKTVNRSKSLNLDIAASPIFRPLTNEIFKLKQNLIKARLAASEEARLTLERIDSPWTAERLQEFVKGILKDRTIYVVSNREPYIHIKEGNNIEVISPASGMVTAIEPLMEACGGTWLAQASGSADRDVVNSKNEIALPPDDPKYKLHRIWLNEEQSTGFYDGFSNEALWPLFHMSHTRPIFRSTDWKQYVKVNQLFANTLLTLIQDVRNPLILVQDFHFALLPRMIKEKRPGAMIGMFWHIPWISAEHFSICPNKEDILYGMLGADLIGFHTQLHCNNFIETVSHEMESLVDYESYTITKEEHKTWIKPFPISIPFSNGYETVEISEEEQKWRTKFLKEYKITTQFIGLGVDRLDYTKGILERLKAVEIFLLSNPTYQEKFTFIQVAAPTRQTVERYQQFAQEVREETERINDALKTKSWKPIVLIEKHYHHEDIERFYRLADFCMVTSLHDGMNLVAKEYVAARNDSKGVLILSNYTGASRELREALIINPYDGEETAEAILHALEMPPAEQTKRMKRLRQTVRDHNVFRWSAEFLKTLVSLG